MLFRASHHSGALELELARRNIPFVKFGGLKFVEASPCQGCDRPAALGGESPRPGGGISQPASIAGRGAGHGAQGARSPGGCRALPSTPWRASSRCRRPRREDWPGLAALLALLAGRAVDWSAQLGLVKQMVSAPARAALRRRGGAPLSDLDQLEAISTTYAGRQAFPEDVMLDPPAVSGEEAVAPRCSTKITSSSQPSIPPRARNGNPSMS